MACGSRMKEILNKLFELAPREAQKEIIKATLAIVGKQYPGIKMSVEEPRTEVEIIKNKPKKKPVPRDLLLVEGIRYSSKRKVCDHYDYDYQKFLRKFNKLKMSAAQIIAEHKAEENKGGFADVETRKRS